MRRTRGFTLIELMVVVAIITLLIGLLLPALAKAQRHTKSMKDGAQQKQIHVSFLTYANANDSGLPVPGLIDRNPIEVDGQPYEMPSEGSEAFEHNWTGPLYSVMIAQRFFETDILIGPTEVNPVVVPYENYDYSQYNPAADNYWDPNLTVNIGAQPGDAELCHASFAHEAICGYRKNRQWRNTQDSTYPIMGTRGVNNGVLPGDDYDRSPTLRLHGTKRQWVGNIVFADNHWEQVGTFYPEQTTYTPQNGDRAVKDNIFSAEFEDDHPVDPRAAGDAWLVISTAAALDGFSVEADYDVLD